MDCDAYRDDMLDVLYGEGGERPRAGVEAHQASCPDCRREMAELRRLRGDLAQWRLPELLRGTATVPRRCAAPLAGLAAAAAVVLAVGAGLLWPGPSCATTRPASRCASAAVRTRAPSRKWSSVTAPRSPPCARSSPPCGRPTSGSSCARWREMIRQSETRQEEARLDSVRILRQRAETQRQYDLARDERGALVSRRQGRAAGGAHHRARGPPAAGFAAEIGRGEHDAATRLRPCPPARHRGPTPAGTDAARRPAAHRHRRPACGPGGGRRQRRPPGLLPPGPGGRPCVPPQGIWRDHRPCPARPAAATGRRAQGGARPSPPGRGRDRRAIRAS